MIGRLWNRLALACALVIALGAGSCVGLSGLAREAALATIRAANAAGLDPWQASPERLARLEVACMSAAGIATVWNPMVPGLDAAGSDLCRVVLAAAGPAVPVEGVADDGG